VNYLGACIRTIHSDPHAPATLRGVERIRERLAERCAAMHRAFTDRLYDAWLERVESHSRRASVA